VILGEALRAGLAALGVDALYGDPAPGLGVVPAPAPWAAELMRLAHDMAGGPSGTVEVTADHVIVRIPGDFHERARGLAHIAVTALETADDLRQVLEELAARAGDGFFPVLTVRADLDAPIDARLLAPPLPPPGAPAGGITTEVAERMATAEHPLLFVGPGVVRRRCIADLHAAAAALDCGVLNTWGAKGVFDWRSPHHWATVGLQEWDYVRGGVGDSDLVLMAGVHPSLDPVPGVLVMPEALSAIAVAARGHRSSGVTSGGVSLPPLRERLAGVTQRGWEHDGDRVMPSQVTRNYGGFTAGRGVVTAAPGVAGFWVARTFPTTVLGEAVVPEARAEAAFAMAAALVAHHDRPGRAVVTAVDGPLDDRSAELLEWASSAGVPMVVEVWDPNGPAIDADAHAARLDRSWLAALEHDGPYVVHVAPDGSQLVEMVDAAGPVTAWGGLTGSSG
jgi:thiamine pyrophosphate-dependent acetolactate synthase large subunit-like protein